MTSEQRTLIQLSDIAGVEFECKSCKARVFYPFDSAPRRLATHCPHCGDGWFFVDPNAHPEANKPYEEVRTVILQMQKLAANPTVLAQVRLCVAGVTKDRE